MLVEVDSQQIDFSLDFSMPRPYFEALPKFHKSHLSPFRIIFLDF